MESISEYLKVQKKLGVEPPFSINLSLQGVKGYRFVFSKTKISFLNVSEYGSDIDRNDLFLSDIILEDYDSDPAIFMKPIFDSLWNSGGQPRSINFKDGKWVKPG